MRLDDGVTMNYLTVHGAIFSFIFTIRFLRSTRASRRSFLHFHLINESTASLSSSTKQAFFHLGYGYNTQQCCVSFLFKSHTLYIRPTSLHTTNGSVHSITLSSHKFRWREKKVHRRVEREEKENKTRKEKAENLVAANSSICMIWSIETKREERREFNEWSEMKWFVIVRRNPRHIF